VVLTTNGGDYNFRVEQIASSTPLTATTLVAWAKSQITTKSKKDIAHKLGELCRDYHRQPLQDYDKSELVEMVSDLWLRGTKGYLEMTVDELTKELIGIAEELHDCTTVEELIEAISA
jgi:hypothetical protein